METKYNPFEIDGETFYGSDIVSFYWDGESTYEGFENASVWTLEFSDDTAVDFALFDQSPGTQLMLEQYASDIGYEQYQEDDDFDDYVIVEAS